jgi:hypothetical protein
VSDDLLRRYVPDPQEAQERRDRELERSDSPALWLDLRCAVCGEPWCSCHLVLPPAA